MLRTHLEHPMGVVHDLASLKGSLQTVWGAITLSCSGKKLHFLSVSPKVAIDNSGRVGVIYTKFWGAWLIRWFMGKIYIKNKRSLYKISWISSFFLSCFSQYKDFKSTHLFPGASSNQIHHCIFGLNFALKNLLIAWGTVLHWCSLDAIIFLRKFFSTNSP